MTATGHAVIGVVIAATIQNPVIAVPLAIGSHVLADLFPHWDTGTNRRNKSKNRFLLEGFLDVLLSLALTLFLVLYLFPKTNLLYAYFIVFAAQFLDWLSAPYLFFDIKRPEIFKLSHDFQKKYFDTRLDKPWGVIGQILILILLIGITLVILDTPIILAS